MEPGRAERRNSVSRGPSLSEQVARKTALVSLARVQKPPLSDGLSIQISPSSIGWANTLVSGLATAQVASGRGVLLSILDRGVAGGRGGDGFDNVDCEVGLGGTLCRL